MPFSSVLGASSVIKPGVVTSSTRPSAPYEGQLIYETDTDRIAAYNGSAWITQNGLVVVKAETGSLVIFNSFIMHMTNRHQNKDENRIVVSANFWPKQPDTTPTQDWSAYSRLEWEDYSSIIKSGA